jgi:pyrroloquinoline quinone biosynthesis protein B
LIDASPDLRRQIEKTREFRFAEAIRGTRIGAVLLTHAHTDHTLGLLACKELITRYGVPIYCTKEVIYRLFQKNELFRLLLQEFQERFKENADKILRPITPHVRNEIIGKDGEKSGLFFEAFYVPHRDEPTVGYRIEEGETGKTLIYIPDIERLDEEVLHKIQGAECLMFDGTFYTNDELQKVGSMRTAIELGHIPIASEIGSMIKLMKLNVRKKIYTHLNNTNPLVDPESDERKDLEKSGFQVAYDGMTILL